MNRSISFNDPSGHDPITFFALLVIGSLILSACDTVPTEAPTVTPTVSAEERLQQINTMADKYNITLPKGTTWGYRDVSELLPFDGLTDIPAGHSSRVTETIPLDFIAYDDKVYITNLGFDPDYYIDEIETVGVMKHESTHAWLEDSFENGNPLNLPTDLNKLKIVDEANAYTVEKIWLEQNGKNFHTIPNEKYLFYMDKFKSLGLDLDLPLPIGQ